MVKVVDYHVSQNYAQKVYESCADVVNPSTSGSVLDLLCGPWGGALCSPQRLLDYLGSISNGYAPFQINYFLHDTTVQKAAKIDLKPHDPPVIPCHKEALKGLGSCSCTDCENACAPPDFEPFKKVQFAKDETFDYWQITVVSIFVIGIILGLVFFVLDRYMCSKNNVVFVEEQKPEGAAGQQNEAMLDVKKSLGARMDLQMTRAFTKIATVSAEHPIKTSVVMLTFGLVLCIGVTQLR